MSPPVSDDSVYMMQAPPPYPGINAPVQPYPPQAAQPSQPNGFTPPSAPGSAAGMELHFSISGYLSNYSKVQLILRTVCQRIFAYIY